MTPNDILGMFQVEADRMPLELPVANEVILELAQLLAESRERLSKETFETLVHIGGVLYKKSRSQVDARADVAAIMMESAKNRRKE